MGILPVTADHNYCRTPTGPSESDSRFRESESVRKQLKQLEIEHRGFQSDHQTNWSNIIGCFCGETECTGGELCEFKTRPHGKSCRRFHDKMAGSARLCVPPFCRIPRCLAKVQKEGGELITITPAWQSQPFYTVLLEMSITDPILLPPQRDLLLSPVGKTHPFIERKTLKLVAWKISGNQSKYMAYQKTLQCYSLQHGEKGHNQLTIAVGDTGTAGVFRNKLIPFVSLWSR